MHFGDMAGCPWLISGPGNAERVVGLQERLLVAVGQGPPFLLADSVRSGFEVRAERLGRLGEDLVVDVRDVADRGDPQPRYSSQRVSWSKAIAERMWPTWGMPCTVAPQ
ncbi:hypothetical protein AHiyo4_08100 [Arthrobacter sp. Hiyo4]|nr:hypothetical protein AHiyo4_08100 [Arthrobacter sp. Hiyo4]